MESAVVRDAAGNVLPYYATAGAFRLRFGNETTSDQPPRAVTRPRRRRARGVRPALATLGPLIPPVVVLPAAATMAIDPALFNVAPPAPTSTVPVIPTIVATVTPATTATAVTTAFPATILAPALPTGPAQQAGVTTIAAHPLGTSACGIVTQAINLPAVMPAGVRARHLQGHLQRYVCVLCGMTTNRALSIRVHFVSCARTNGNPQGHSWHDHASVAGFTHRDPSRTTYSTDR
ncbi:hypothetical protein MMC17_007319 [Xylographa soralifera]|nr:hypothetical protein [Xylographa soralifera]